MIDTYFDDIRNCEALTNRRRGCENRADISGREREMWWNSVMGRPGYMQRKLGEVRYYIPLEEELEDLHCEMSVPMVHG